MASRADWDRTDSNFGGPNSRCAAWLYLPRGAARPPVVVMAHGFAAERDFGLPAVAERFAARGLAVLLFDYRHFGASDGSPRQLLSFHRQLDDWRSAVAHARSLRSVNAQRIGLWGTSLSGGHVLVTAARVPGISAIVAQTPMVDVPACVPRYGAKYIVQALAHGIWDGLQSLAGFGRHYIPVVGPPGRFAALNQPGAVEGYSKLVPPGRAWPNRVAAYALVRLTTYRPIAWAGRIDCPAMLVLAEQDQIVAPRTVRKAAERMPRAELVAVAGDHFDVYEGELQDQLIAQQADFFVQHLLEENSFATPPGTLARNGGSL